MVNFLNVEGLIIENKALTNHELIYYIKQLNIKNFRGVFMRDNLPKKRFKKECGIVNLDDSFSGGTHWVCYFNNYYFDSYGLQPPLEIVEYLKQPQFNIYQIQKSGKICGHLCLYFLNQMSKGNEFNDVIFSLLK